MVRYDLYPAHISYDLYESSEKHRTIAKADLQKCPGKSSKCQSCFSCPSSLCSLSCLAFFVVHHSRGSCQMSPQMTCLKSLNGRICKELGSCIKASRRLHIRIHQVASKIYHTCKKKLANRGWVQNFCVFLVISEPGSRIDIVKSTISTLLVGFYIQQSRPWLRTRP